MSETGGCWMRQASSSPDTLVDWDFQEDLDVIEPSLQAKFAALFREFLTDADDIAKILPWKFEQAVG